MANPTKVAAEALEAFNAHDEKRMRACYSDDATLEATLKRWFRQADGRIRLEPANRTMHPVVVDRCEVQGVVVSVVRKL